MTRGNVLSIARRGGAMSVVVAAASLALGACAKFSPDGGMTFVAEQSGGILGKDAVKIRTPDRLGRRAIPGPIAAVQVFNGRYRRRNRAAQ